LKLVDVLLEALPTAAAVLLVAGALVLAGKLFDRWEQHGQARRFSRQLTLLGLTVAGLVVVVLSLPLPPSEKGNLLSLIGIVLSAAIALSSTTVLGNILAGLMIRSLRRLRTGDFVESGDQFGRVTELGLLFTEIQAKDSNLWQVPNLYLVQRPLQVVRSQGTIVTADVSLGYDVPRQAVREALRAAAEEAGLEDPFVLVQDLGDFSVCYRCGGLLKEVKSLVSANSTLRAEMLDALHGAGIEIVSPSFMNTRALESSRRMVPPAARPGESEDADEGEEGAGVEAIAVEKADAAELAAALRQQLANLEEQRDQLAERAKAARKTAKEGEPSEAEDLEQAVHKVDSRIERLQTMLQARASELEA
jgi:small-conductance mechanosensitive channel